MAQLSAYPTAVTPENADLYAVCCGADKKLNTDLLLDRTFHTGVQLAATISDLNNYVVTRVTFETLNSNGDVGSGATQLAAGNHAHNNLYFTETELSTSGGGGSVHWDNITNVPASMTPAAHASNHAAGGSDEVDGDLLDIDYSPVNYTATVSAPATQTYHLTAHLAGISAAIGGKQTSLHLGTQSLAPGGTTQTVDWASGNYVLLDLSGASGNVTLTLSNPIAGNNYLIRVTQGGTARDLIFPAGSTQIPTGGNTVSACAPSTDEYLTVRYDGSNYQIVRSNVTTLVSWKETLYAHGTVSSGTTTLDYLRANVHSLTVGASAAVTLAFANFPAGGTDAGGILIHLTMDTTGSVTWPTVAWGSAGAPALDTNTTWIISITRIAGGAYRGNWLSGY